MGGLFSATPEPQGEIRNDAERNYWIYDFLTHIMEKINNWWHIYDDNRDPRHGAERDARHEDERDPRHGDERHARHEEKLISDSEETSSSTSDEEKEEEVKFYDPADTTLTFVEGDDDLDFVCAGYKSLRAQMSCGHAVTPTSLTNWCRRLLDEGDSKFVCGQTGCDLEWPFDEVCKMALLTPEEIEDFEKKVFQNAAKDFLDVKCCPGCKSRVMRTDLNNLNVKCPVCTARNKRTYTFCWLCLKKWKGPAWSDHCGNDDCKNQLEILKSCLDITFLDVKGVIGCPSIRACPTCGLLLEHNRTKCKNVVCDRCKVEFCFVCLKLTKDCMNKNNRYFYLCSGGVAPRQTSMPVRQRR